MISVNQWRSQRCLLPHSAQLSSSSGVPELHADINIARSMAPPWCVLSSRHHLKVWPYHTTYHFIHQLIRERLTIHKLEYLKTSRNNLSTYMRPIERPTTSPHAQTNICAGREAGNPANGPMHVNLPSIQHSTIITFQSAIGIVWYRYIQNA